MVEMKEEQNPTVAFPLSETHFPPTRFSESNRHHVWKRTGLTTATAPQMGFFSDEQVPTDGLHSFTKLKNNSQLQQHLFPLSWGWTSLIEQSPLTTMLLTIFFWEEM